MPEAKSIPLTPNLFSIVQVPSVHDGDTLRCRVSFHLEKLGLDMSGNVVVRLAGVDAPELKSEQGVKVRSVVFKWVTDHFGAGIQLEAHGVDEYRRVLGNLVGPNGSLNTFLLGHGLVRAYDGSKKTPWTAEQLAVIDAYKE